VAETPELIHDGPADAPAHLILAHSAGAGADSAFLQTFAEGFASRGVHVVRFEFPYMAHMRAHGGRRPPDRQPVLSGTLRAVVDAVGAPARTIVGGKSMGGRMATMAAAELEHEGKPVAGAAVLGYPFHPPGKPSVVRTGHLQDIATPMLLLQGETDPFGTPPEVETYTLADSVEVSWFPHADHHLTPRSGSGESKDAYWARAMDEVDAFARRVTA